MATIQVVERVQSVVPGYDMRVIGYGEEIFDKSAHAAYMQRRGEVYMACNFIDASQVTDTGAEKPDSYDGYAIHIVHGEPGRAPVGLMRLVERALDDPLPVEDDFELELDDDPAVEVSRFIAHAPENRGLQKTAVIELAGFTLKFCTEQGYRAYSMQEQLALNIMTRHGLVYHPLGPGRSIAEYQGTFNVPYELDVLASLDVDTATTERQARNRALWNRMMESL